MDGKGACSNMEVKRGEDPFPLSPEGCDLRIFLSRAASAPLVTDREADGEPERAPCPAPQRGCGSPGSSGTWGLSWGSRGPGQASCCPAVSPPEREDPCWGRPCRQRWGTSWKGLGAQSWGLAGPGGCAGQHLQTGGLGAPLGRGKNPEKCLQEPPRATATGKREGRPGSGCPGHAGL